MKTAPRNGSNLFFAAFLLLLGSALSAAAQQKIEWVKADVSTITVLAQPQRATVTAKVSLGPDLLPNSVSVARYDEAGAMVASLGAMYDDGTHGDANLGDGIFTAQITINEPGPAAFIWGVSAQFRGLPQPVVKAGRIIFVQSGQACEEALPGIAAAIEAGDPDGVAKSFSSGKSVALVLRLTDALRKSLTDRVRSAVLDERRELSCVFQIQDLEPSVQTPSTLVLSKGALGGWFVSVW